MAKHKLLIFCAIWACILSLTHKPVLAQDIPTFNILTEDWVPYQYMDNSTLRGAAVDVVVHLLDKVGSSQSRKDIKLYPWARAYNELQEKPGTILFSTTRTPERENLFKWVCPIFTNTTYLIGKKSKGITIASPSDIHSYQVGTIIDDASELYAQRMGLSLDQVQRNTKSHYNIKKMEIDRIDLIISGWEAFESDAKTLGYDPNRYETVYTVDTEQVCLAFHRETPSDVIHIFKTALDDLTSEGVVSDIFKKYGISDE
jgi:polar amino acid transport system substrate-binding protein